MLKRIDDSDEERRVRTEEIVINHGECCKCGGG